MTRHPRRSRRCGRSRAFLALAAVPLLSAAILLAGGPRALAAPPPIILDGSFDDWVGRYVGRADQAWLRSISWVILVMPAFRFMVYWFRLAGILHAVAEPQRWNTHPFDRRVAAGTAYPSTPRRKAVPPGEPQVSGVAGTGSPRPRHTGASCAR